MDAPRWKEIRALFDELVECPPAERADRLAAIGGGDRAMRETLESLLAADPRSSGGLGVPGLGRCQSSPDEPAPDPFGLTARTISHFRVLEPLGAGGMGVVYRAEDTRLGRTVALKLPLPQYALDPSTRDRFIQEARSAAALDHPNLCNVHEVGESEDGRVFLAMTLYPGETLKARLAREGALPVQQAVDIAMQVARGLACAHGAGIVHRDLTPANLMLLPDGTVKILDFGLAKARDLTVTDPERRMGTVTYMAPEQMLGNPTDERVDLWALGVVLYEMLTGRRPFLGEHELSIAHSIVHDEPVDPSKLRGEAAGAVEEIVLSLLAKDPRRRPASAADAVEALTTSRPTEGTRARRTSIWAGRLGRHAFMLRSAAGGAVLSLIGIAAVSVWLTFVLAVHSGRSGGVEDVARERSVAVLPVASLTADPESEVLAGALQAAVIAQLAKVPDVSVINSGSARAYAGTYKSLRQIGRELGVGRIVLASLQRADGRVRVTAELVDPETERSLWAHAFDRVDTDLFGLQREIALSIVGALEAKLTAVARERLTRQPTSNDRAYDYFFRGWDYQERVRGAAILGSALGDQEIRVAESLYRQALALDPNFALAHAYLAQVHGELYFFGFDASPARRDQLRTAAETALRLEPNLPEAHVAMGYYWYVAVRDFARALTEFEIAREGLPGNGLVRIMIANVHRRQGRWAEALAGYEQGLRLDPLHSDNALNLARTYHAMGRYQDAVKTWDRAIALNPDNYVYTLSRARVFLHWQGNLDSLEAALRRVPSGYDPRGAMTMSWIDLALMRRRPADALPAVSAMNPQLLARDDRFAARLRTQLARLHEALGDTARARVGREASLAFLERARAETPQDPSVAADLAVVYAALGRRQEAVHAARRTAELMPLQRDAWTAPVLLLRAAEAYGRVGEVGSAMDLVESALNTPHDEISVQMLLLDPRWEPLRRDPRFQRLLVTAQAN